MKNSKLEIRSVDEKSIYCEVLIDGHVVHGVRSIRFEKKAHSMPVVHLDFNCINMSIDSPFVTRLEGNDGEGEIEIKFKNQDHAI